METRFRHVRLSEYEVGLWLGLMPFDRTLKLMKSRACEAIEVVLVCGQRVEDAAPELKPNHEVLLWLASQTVSVVGTTLSCIPDVPLELDQIVENVHPFFLAYFHPLKLN